MPNLKHIHPLGGFLDARKNFTAGLSSPRAYLDQCIAHIEASESTIKSFTAKKLEIARKNADESSKRYVEGNPLSLIDGMPIGVKDIIDTTDFPTEMGNSFFNGHQPKIDAPCVRALKLGGAIILGKTVTTEFAIGRSGPTVNPWNTAHTPGGSSSGSAAGVGSGFMSAAFGTQTQGSIIRPASFCGVVGFKPSLGMLPTEGIHPLSRSHDHLGILAQGVREAWAVTRWVSQVHAGQNDRGLQGAIELGDRPTPMQQVAFLKTKGWDELDAASQNAFETTLEKLRQAGVTIVTPEESVQLKSLCELLDFVPDYSLDMVSMDMRWPFTGYIEIAPDHMGPRFKELMARASSLSQEDYQLRLSFRDGLRARMAELSQRFDALVLPAASSPAPEGFVNTGSRTLLTYSSFMGTPSFSLPVMTVDEMPFGLQLMGFMGADYQLAQHAQWTSEILS